MNRNPISIAMMLILLLSGCATVPAHRQVAADKLRELEPLRIAQLQAEYRSVEEAFLKGEELLRRSDPEGAERYYELALLKGEVYEQHLQVERRNLARQMLSLPHPKMRQSFPPMNRNLLLAQGMQEFIFSSEKEQLRLLPLKRWSWSDFQPETETAVLGSTIIGGRGKYIVQQGDTISLIGAKLGMSWARLAKMNGIDRRTRIKPGQRLKYDDRKILPRVVRDGVIINIPDRTLYHFQKGKFAAAIPVALGMSAKENALWNTPTGSFKIVAKIQDPSWFVPTSIQDEMEKAGKEVLVVVPPGDDNPLGKYALRTSIPGIMIHSTNAPGSIYGFSSHGCIRINPSHMEQLFKEIKVNTPGEIIYEPVKVAVTDDGRILLEVHNDIYRKVKDFEEATKALLAKNNLDKQVSWEKVQRVLQRKSGIPEDVTLPATESPILQVAEK